MERNITLIALFAALVAALGLIPKLTLGFGVPITAQSMGIMLCGTILGARRGALAVLLVLALVALGLPLLAGGRGGLGVFAGPTVGFLVGWPIAAFVTGLIVERWRSGSLAAEISARIMEQAFWSLDAPVGRVCSAEVPIPYPHHLEQAAIPQVPAIVAAAKATMGR